VATASALEENAAALVVVTWITELEDVIGAATWALDDVIGASMMMVDDVEGAAGVVTGTSVEVATAVVCWLPGRHCEYHSLEV
jgi:hypothetical protein